MTWLHAPRTTKRAELETHLKVVAALFLALGGLLLTLALFSSALLGTIAMLAGHSGDPDATIGAALVGMTGVALAVGFTIIAIPSLLAGWGLLRRRPWARIVGIVVAAISLLKFPFGTAFGVYALWVLLNGETERVLGK